MAEEAQQAASRPKGRGSVPLMVVIGVVLALNAAVAGKVFLGGKGDHKPRAKPVEEVGVKLPLEEFLVNLAGGGDHYLKITLALGLRKDVTEDKMKEDIAPARDAILSVLSDKTIDDVSTEAAKDRLKHEMIDRLNQALGGPKVLKIYFTSFATQ